MIKWPKELDPKEGWAQTRGNLRVASEPRAGTSLYVALQRDHGLTAGQLIAMLGGPKSKNLDRDLNAIRSEVQAYYQKHGERPTRKSSPLWNSHGQWLRCRGLTLSKLCDELALEGGLKSDRTLGSIRSEIERYHQKHGKRPTKNSPVLWAAHDAWLRHQGTSLAKLCDELGLEGRHRNRTEDSIREEVRGYHQRHGKRPTDKISRTWGGHDEWLRRRGSSLSKLCDELGLEGRCLNRTEDSIREEILKHYRESGKRPSKTTSLLWNNHDAWLHRQGTSLSKLCDRMGLGHV